MRNYVKYLAIPCAAAVLTIGASMVSFAASGWKMEGQTWSYYEADGSQAADTWRKSGNRWFYLNSEGEMAVSTLVEDDDAYYYVNSAGAMVTNQWREIPNEDYGEEDAPETYWYYFQANGKAYTSGNSDRTTFKAIRKANGETRKYAFDSQGRMLTGWVNENAERLTGEDAWKEGIYYCGGPSDGAQISNAWQYLEAVDGENEDDNFEDAYWFYFGSNGKKAVDTTKTINGKKYRFNENGATEYSWYTKASDGSATPANLYYNHMTRCWLATGWFRAVPGEEIDPEAYDNEEAYWFYAEKNGDLVTSEIRSINGYKYAFNEKGEMLHGLYKLTFDGKKISSWEEIEEESDLPEADDDVFVYYFGDSPKEGVMKTGKCTITIDGEKYTYNFRKSGSDKGSGYDAIFEDSIYIKGRLLKADSDARYETVEYKGNTYLINTSGKLVKNKKNIKDADETYYSTDKNGIVIYEGSEKQ